MASDHSYFTINPLQPLITHSVFLVTTKVSSVGNHTLYSHSLLIQGILVIQSKGFKGSIS